MQDAVDLVSFLDAHVSSRGTHDHGNESSVPVHPSRMSEATNVPLATFLRHIRILLQRTYRSRRTGECWNAILNRAAMSNDHVLQFDQTD